MQQLAEKMANATSPILDEDFKLKPPSFASTFNSTNSQESKPQPMQSVGMSVGSPKKSAVNGLKAEAGQKIAVKKRAVEEDGEQTVAKRRARVMVGDLKHLAPH